MASRDYASSLDQSLYEHRQRLEPFRENARKRIEAAAADNYGKRTRTKRRPYNFNALAASIYAHRLMSTNPQTLWSTDDDSLEESCLEQEAALNQWIKQTDAGRPMNEAVVHAIYSGLGILQVGIQAYSYDDDPGATRFTSIGFDDWVHDMGADRIEDCTILGHRYRACLSDVQKDENIPEEIRNKLIPSPVRTVDNRGGKKVSKLSRDRDYFDEYEPKIELWQLYFPKERKLEVYRACDNGGGLVISGDPLRSVRWEGPRMGPYDILEFMPLPGNSIPLAPAAMWEELDDALNDAVRKLIYDVRRSKTILAYQKNQTGDMKTISETLHGHGAGLDAPDSARELALGHPNPMLVSVIPQLRQLASMIAGNTDQIGGIAAQTDTVGQEKLLSDSSQVSIQSMQKAVLHFSSKAFRHAAGWIFSDPQLNLRASKRIPGTDMKVPFTMTSANVEGHPDDYSIEIAPYSEVYRSPGERLNQIGTILNGLIMPLAGMFQSQGAMPDAQYILRTVSRLSGLPELEKFFHFFGPENPSVPEQPGAAGGNSKRTYERTDRHQNSMAEQETAMMQNMQSMASAGAA